MQVDIIEQIAQFEDLKSDWDRVYAGDPHAHIFVSWAWLRGWFEATPYHWFVLALRPDNSNSYVAFLPLAIENYKSNLLRLLRMGGNQMADYTGFVCSPEYEEQALETFAHYLQQQQRWDAFHLKDVLDPRLDHFLKEFNLKSFRIQQLDRIPCPYVVFSNDSYDSYLQDLVGKRTREKIRRYTRKVESIDSFRITHVNRDNLEDQIETLLYLWHLRWGIEPYGQRAVFRRCFENDNLWLTIFWADQSPITGLGGFIDHAKKTFSYFISGYDRQYIKLSPGLVMVGYSIRYAIENGFKTYDFLRGDEEYKYSFGAVDRNNTHTVIIPTTVRSRTANAVVELGKRLRRGSQTSV